MMRLLKTIAVAFSMYSKIPMPQFVWNKDNMRWAMCCFPIVGAFTGGVFYLFYLLCTALGAGDLFRASVLVLIPVLITGGIHLDGFIDTADALSSWQTKEKRLSILKDPHVGAFAVICACAYFIADLGAMSAVDMTGAGVLSAGFILSRALSGYGVCTFKKASEKGTAAAFAQAAHRGKSRIILIIEALAAIALMIYADPAMGTAAAAAAVVCCAACRKMSIRSFGGITGDIQGFFLQLCELSMAFAVVIAGHISVYLSAAY